MDQINKTKGTESFQGDTLMEAKTQKLLNILSAKSVSGHMLSTLKDITYKIWKE